MNNTTTLTRDEPLSLQDLASHRLVYLLMILIALPVLAILWWQGATSAGVPDPLAPAISPLAGMINIGVLVFREGLESVLVIAAITAGLVRRRDRGASPIFFGAAFGLLASLITWILVRGVVQDLTQSISYLALQAATGMLAVLVLLVTMNWFFHKIYWGGWITLHNRQKNRILDAARRSDTAPGTVYWGLVLLGITSVYREGFECVIFLQSYMLRLGGWPVLYGSLIGLGLTGIVALITFWLHQRLPYRKMLIFSGIMLGFVLLVVVGEQANEMQLAGWISSTTIPALQAWTPEWTGIWFALFPTLETIGAQVFAAVFVIGSYFLSRRLGQSSLAGSTSGAATN